MLFLTMLVSMLVWHALADYPLQGDFLARAKNCDAPVPGVPWYQAMSAHALIHAGGVWLITGSLLIGAAEFIAHFLIDLLKCRGELSFNNDQMLHVLCKVLWAFVAYIGLVVMGMEMIP